MANNNENVIDEALKSDVLTMLQNGDSITKARKHIQESLKCGRTKARGILIKIQEESESEKGILECSKGYIFNTKDRNYIVFLKNCGKNVVVPEVIHKNIMKAYVENVPVEEIALRFSFPANYILEYKRLFGWVRRGVAITDEDALELSVDNCVEKMLAEKKFSIVQEFNKRSWKQTREYADKWENFTQSKFEPFNRALEKWSPPKLIPFSSTLPDKNSDKIFVVGLSDLHFGAESRSCYMFNKEGWNTEKTVECVDKFATDITKEVKNRNYKFKKCLILGLGDILHSVNGKTGRGTELNYDYIEEEQFDYALDSLRVFIQRMGELFGEVEVRSVGGNHHYEGDVMLFRALDMFFRQDKRINFYHHASRPSSFVCDSTLIMMDHGADHKERAYVPASGPKLENHVQSLLLSIPDQVSKSKTCLFIQGDKHHFQHIEYSDFEFIMLGTTLGSDLHASVNNLKNRARQSCLVLDSTGLREILHCYFD